MGQGSSRRPDSRKYSSRWRPLRGPGGSRRWGGAEEKQVQLLYSHENPQNVSTNSNREAVPPTARACYITPTSQTTKGWRAGSARGRVPGARRVNAADVGLRCACPASLPPARPRARGPGGGPQAPGGGEGATSGPLGAGSRRAPRLASRDSGKSRRGRSAGWTRVAPGEARRPAAPSRPGRDLPAAAPGPPVPNPGPPAAPPAQKQGVSSVGPSPPARPRAWSAAPEVPARPATAGPPTHASCRHRAFSPPPNRVLGVCGVVIPTKWKKRSDVTHSALPSCIEA